MIPASDSRRLFASFAVSCLLHAALVFLPFLGASRSASQLALLGGKKPKAPSVLNATLALTKSTEFAIPDAPAKEGSRADYSAERVVNEEPQPAVERAVGIGLLPLPAPTYYTTDQLTKRPQPTAAPELDTPEIRPLLASGTIILKLWINEFGDVTSVDIEKTDLPEKFSAAAVEAFRRLRFIPGELNGRRVSTMMRIEVTYDDGRKPPP